MKINKFNLILALSIIILSLPTLALTDTMGEGETKTFNLGGTSYQTTVMIIEDVTPATVTFEINGVIVPQLQDGDEYSISQLASILIDDIILNEAGEAGSGDIVVFTFRYCGDNICSNEEHCGICNSDCGCEGGYFCDFDACEPIECGDGVCSYFETCEKDNCCYGDEKDLNSNTYNCGTCGNSCDFKEKCIEGVCQGYCGNNICEESEKDFCFDDCVQREIIEEPVIEEEPEIVEIEEEIETIIEEPEVVEPIIEPEIIEIEETTWVKKILRWLGFLKEDVRIQPTKEIEIKQKNEIEVIDQTQLPEEKPKTFENSEWTSQKCFAENFICPADVKGKYLGCMTVMQFRDYAKFCADPCRSWIIETCGFAGWNT